MALRTSRAGADYGFQPNTVLIEHNATRLHQREWPKRKLAEGTGSNSLVSLRAVNFSAATARRSPRKIKSEPTIRLRSVATVAFRAGVR